MSTLENFQLGEVPAAPSNHHDCDERPIQVDLRYHLYSATPPLNVAVIRQWNLFVDHCQSALRVIFTTQICGRSLVRYNQHECPYSVL